MTHILRLAVCITFYLMHITVASAQVSHADSLKIDSLNRKIAEMQQNIDRMRKNDSLLNSKLNFLYGKVNELQTTPAKPTVNDSLAASIRALENKVTVLSADQDKIMENLYTFHEKYRVSQVVKYSGLLFLISAIAIPQEETAALYALLGFSTYLTGAVMQSQAFKYIGLAGRRKQKSFMYSF